MELKLVIYFFLLSFGNYNENLQTGPFQFNLGGTSFQPFFPLEGFSPSFFEGNRACQSFPFFSRGKNIYLLLLTAPTLYAPRPDWRTEIKQKEEKRRKWVTGFFFFFFPHSLEISQFLSPTGGDLGGGGGAGTDGVPREKGGDIYLSF